MIDKAMQGEAKAKAEFAAASRRIATVFDNVRETAKSDHIRAKNEANTAPRERSQEGDRRCAAAMKPLIETGHIADEYRERLDELAAIYRKFKLDPEMPPPSRESYTKFEDPPGEILNRLTRMEPPLKILEGLIIPKSLKGANEAWIFILTTVIAVGLTAYLDLGFSGIAGAPSRASRSAGCSVPGSSGWQSPSSKRLYHAAATVARRRRRPECPLPLRKPGSPFGGTQAAGLAERGRPLGAKDNRARAIATGELVHITLSDLSMCSGVIP